MKKLLLLAFICLTTASYSQNVIVTPNGLRDSNQKDKAYVVINAEGKSANQLYDNALKYVNKNYKNPDKVIKGKIEGEYIKFITHVSNFLVIKNSGVKVLIDANYTIELSFKEGKVKFEIIELDMYDAKTHKYNVLFSGGAMAGYPIYNKKGSLKRPDTKTEIETYFNGQISSITDFLLEKKNDDNW